MVKLIMRKEILSALLSQAFESVAVSSDSADQHEQTGMVQSL